MIEIEGQEAGELPHHHTSIQSDNSLWNFNASKEMSFFADYTPIIQQSTDNELPALLPPTLICQLFVKIMPRLCHQIEQCAVC